MPKYSTKLIFNPNANLGRAWQAAADLRPVVEELGGADWSGTVYPTHATELARDAAEAGYQTVVAVGGDGTVHEVVNGLMQIPPERRPSLGVVPIGSGNDFSFAVGMSAQAPEALRQVFSSSPRKIDIGRLEDERGRIEYFDNTCGIGFDTTVTIRSRKIPIVQGFLLYFTAVLQTIVLNHVAPPMQLDTDQENWQQETIMIVVCNGPREGGGFMVAPEARPDDGLFHYATIGKVSRPYMFRLLPEVIRGTHGGMRQVRMGTLRRLDLKSGGPMYIHMDGEIFSGFGMDVRQIKISIEPGALCVLAPDPAG